MSNPQTAQHPQPQVTAPTSPPKKIFSGSDLNRPVRISDFLVVGLQLGALIWLGVAIERARIRTPNLADHWSYLFFIAVPTWFVSSYLLIWLHEFAHAAAAWLTGGKVLRISIGHGPRLFRIRLRDAFLDVHSIPSRGACYSLPSSSDDWRWRKAVMIAAGPFAHIVVLAAITWIWIANDWSDQESFTTGSTVAATIFIANLLLLVSNLFPRDAHGISGPTRTDGGHLFKLLGGNSESTSFTKATIEMIGLAEQGKWDEVQRIGRECLNSPLGQGLQASYFLGAWVAVADVWVEGTENLDDANRLSARGMELLNPDSATLTVRACVLMAFNRNDEAEDLLARTPVQTLNPFAEKAAAHLWTELHRRKNNPDQMLYWQSIAQKLDPTAAYKIFRDPSSLATVIPLLTTPPAVNA